MIQRPKDGTVILGGGSWTVPITELLGQTDDSVKLSPITEHFRTAMSNYLDNWGEEAIGEGLLCDWTGIMGYTPEGNSTIWKPIKIYDTLIQRCPMSEQYMKSLEYLFVQVTVVMVNPLSNDIG